MLMVSSVRVDIIPASSEHLGASSRVLAALLDFASTSSEHSSKSKTETQTHLNMAEASDKTASTASEDAQPKTEQQVAAPGEVCPAPSAL